MEKEETNKNVELHSLNREANDLVPCTSEAKGKKPRSSDQHFKPQNVKKPRVLALKPRTVE